MATQVFTTMEASPGDPLHDLICKAVYWAQVTAEAGGGSLGTQIYPNMSPSPGDSLQTLAAKLTYWLQAVSTGGGGGGVAQQVYTGAAPPAAPTNPANPAIFYPTGGGAIKEWNGAAWV